MSKIYSPTQTQSWLDDPLKWYLTYHEGWRPRVLDKPAIARIIGAGVAAGAAMWYRSADQQGAIDAARKAVGTELAGLLALGHVVAPAVGELAGRAPTLAEQGVAKLTQFDLPSTWAVVDVERTLPDHGRCRIDVGVQTPHGPGVWDVKCTLASDDWKTFLARTEYEASWQLLHYVWSYGEVVGEPVTQYGVIYVPLEPKSQKPEMFTYGVDPELLSLWELSARNVWGLMEAEETGYKPAPHCSFRFFGRYGRDSHTDAVLKYKLDPTLMEQGYVKHPRKEPTS